MKQKLEREHFFVAMYLRLSRDDEDKDGTSKVESNSISSQRELIRSFLREQADMELFDCYVDDGFSGSNFDRPEFKRMIADIETGRVNCVIVKDLSRFGRDYIEMGRYLERIFPTYGVRFIALTDHYDSFLADAGERTIVLPVKNFINDSYCRDISTKVKSQLAVKRKAGEYLGAFARYGYQKDPEDKNRLIMDEYASDIVRRIFAWKIQGVAVAAIANRLNELGILSPKEYKKFKGDNYKGGFSGKGESKWGSASVKRILTDEIYLGHMIQGRTEKINYKIKKCVNKPNEAWVRVENTHEPIISQDDFMIVQNLLSVDGRICPSEKDVNPFMGLLYCGDCKEQMVRRVVRYKDTCKTYYICSTKNRGEGCTRHSIEETALKGIVSEMVRIYANSFLEQKRLFEQSGGMETDFSILVKYNKEILRLRVEQDKYYTLCSGLYDDLRKGVITKEEFERLHEEFEGKAKTYATAQEKQKELIQEMLKAGIVSAARLQAFQDCMELKEIDRHTLASLVKRIYIHENKRIEMEFYFTNQFLVMQDFNEGAVKPGIERRA